MRRALTTVALLAACAAAWLGHPSQSPAASHGADRVVVVLAPYLSWEDVTPTSTPTLWKLADRGAVGAVNARSRVRQSGEIASPLEGALTLSAGSWAMHSGDAPAAYNVDERYEVGTAAEAFERTTGYQAGESQVVFLGMPMTDRLNAERSFDVVLGALGEAIEDQGGVTAAVGNSDIGYATSEQRRVRPAALAAMNAEGLVAKGDVSRRLLREDPDAPFGIETDLKVYARTLESLADELDAHDGPALVVLDAGDSYRATKFADQVTSQIAEVQHTRALSTLDSVVALAEERLGDAVIMVVSQSTGDPALGQAEGLGPIVVSGDGWSGYLTSNSTQRPGLVTNLDVTATALDVLGVERPVSVIGNEMRAVTSPPSIEARVGWLSRLNETAVAVDEAKPGVVNAFVLVTVAILGLSTIVLVRSRYWRLATTRTWVVGLKAALLFVLGVPVSSWLMFVWMPRPVSASQAVLALMVTALALWLLALLVWRYTALRVPVAVVSLATVAVLLIDQWVGAPASFTNFFGYSPLLAARFYGIGNEAAAILFGAAIVGVALLFDEWPGSKAVVAAKRFGLPVLGIAVVMTAAAPFLGANVGVAIWGLVGFALASVLMNGHHVSWRMVFWMFLGVVVVIVGFAAIDLLGGGEQTHLARALTSAEQGGLGELWTIVARKAATNARVLTRTNWAYILVATLAFLAFMRWRPAGDFADSLGDNPDFADAITVSLAAGVVAYFTEDSGIVIPALEVFYVGVALSWLMLSRLLEAGRQADWKSRTETESAR